MLRAVQQRPHIRLVPPGHVDHQHPCKAWGKGQTEPGVIPQCQEPAPRDRQEEELSSRVERGWTRGHGLSGEVRHWAQGWRDSKMAVGDS